MTNPAQNPIERAADDLLLLLARVDSPDVPLPGPDEVGAVVSAYTAEAMPKVARRMAGNRVRAADVEFGFTTAADAMTAAAAGHLVLSVQLLVWAAQQTGMTHAEVVAAVLAAAEGQED